MNLKIAQLPIKMLTYLDIGYFAEVVGNIRNSYGIEHITPSRNKFMGKNREKKRSFCKLVPPRNFYFSRRR
jgi:hypothetical protein